jgi:hypothetical protein
MSISAPQLANHFALAVVGAGLVDHRLMHVRVEVGAERVEGPHAALAQDVVQLRVDQLHALPVSRAAVGVDRQGAIEIVETSSNSSSRSRSPVDLLPALALDAACGSCRTRRICAASGRNRRARAEARPVRRRKGGLADDSAGESSRPAR